MAQPDFLDENEKKALIVFNSSETMKQAVKKVLLSALYENGRLKPGIEPNPMYNGAFGLLSMEGKMGDSFSNEEIGADLRALWQGVSQIEVGFGKISEFVAEPKVGTKTNPAK